jgi:hypothetical protein
VKTGIDPIAPAKKPQGWEAPVIELYLLVEEGRLSAVIDWVVSAWVTQRAT